jgi:hypothetical protein
MKMTIVTFTNADDGLQARIEAKGKLLRVSLVDLDIERWHGTEYATVGNKFFAKTDEEKAYRTAAKWSGSDID